MIRILEEFIHHRIFCLNLQQNAVIFYSNIKNTKTKLICSKNKFEAISSC